MQVKIFATWVQRKWDKEPNLEFDRLDLADLYRNTCDVVAIAAGEFDLELDIIPLNHDKAVLAQVECLRKEAGTHQAAITGIEARINELLCLEHKP